MSLEYFLDRVSDKVVNRANPFVNIVAFGDSITMGAFSPGECDFQAVYHNQLKIMLETEFPSVVFNVINSGIGGQNVCDAIPRIERDVIKYNPDLIIVAFGMNDSNDGIDGLQLFDSGLSTIMDEIAAKTTSDIILLTPSFKNYGTSYEVAEEHKDILMAFSNDQTQGVLKCYAEVIRDKARMNKLTLVDVYREWESLRERGIDTDILLANGLNHPVRIAHKLVAEMIMQAILPDYRVHAVEEIVKEYL